MKTTTANILLLATGVAASIFDTILPREKGTITRDPWTCATRILETYFDVPKPTGDLLTALLDYGDEVQKGCKSTLTDALGMPACTFPPYSDLCAFSDAAPSTLLSEYSSYGSVASSWWAEHSSAAVEQALECPNRWFKAMNSLPYGALWLNDTIAFASCYVEAHASGAARAGQVPSATTGAAANAAAPKETAAMNGANRVAGRADKGDVWMVAGTGLAAAAINSAL